MCFVPLRAQDDEIEVDMDVLDNGCLRALEEYVAQCMKKPPKRGPNKKKLAANAALTGGVAEAWGNSDPTKAASNGSSSSGSGSDSSSSSSGSGSDSDSDSDAGGIGGAKGMAGKLG